MKSQFRHVALIGKYHAQGSRSALEDIAHFLGTQGCDVAIEQDTASNTGLTQFPTLNTAQIGAQCDLALVVGGDGTMLGIGRLLAQFGVPLVGINQGRLGFITDIAFDDYQDTLEPMLRGEFEEDRRWMMQAKVVRDGRCVFRILVPIAPHTLSNRPIVLSDSGEITVEIVAGRDASANFDMQSLASLLHGDRITVRRSEHQMRFLHPKGWSYFDTLRKKLHWNEGGA